MKSRILLAGLIGFAIMSMSVFAQTPIVVEAETFTREEGGKVVKTPGRPGASGDCLTTWNSANHVLEWTVEAPEAGQYSILMHIAAGRDGTVYREIKVNGAIPSDSFKKIPFAPTGGFGKMGDQWKKIIIMNGAEPALLTLKKGTNIITMNNLGGDGLDGAMNIDYFTFIPKGMDASSLMVTKVEVIDWKPAAIPAFPGAEGFGKFTQGGRGGQVLTVTNLNDSGPGSLREAVTTKGPRTIVFAVSGNIHLKSALIISEPYCTIAGQTAPGDGITLMGETLSIAGGHIIVRYIRVRPGSIAVREVDSLSVDNANYVIVDHVSASWSIDETVSVSESDNVSIQWSLITESLTNSLHSKGSHGYGSLVRGFGGQKVSYHHNLYAHHKTRMPRPGNYLTVDKDPIGLIFDFRNNVVYGFSSDYIGYNADKNAVSSYNFINNYYKAGPESSNRTNIFNESGRFTKAYFAGNSFNGKVPSDQWSLVTGITDTPGFRQTSPMFNLDYPDESAESAYKKVLESAGASLKRDAVDKRIIEQVKKGTGKSIDSEKEVGGFPALKEEKGPVDSDKDGMSDAWEKSQKLDPFSPLDANQVKPGEIYTNLERYINSLVK